jgi:hypothetical protein
MKLWGYPTGDISLLANTEESSSYEIAWRTEELLSTQGWCLWRCSNLDGDIIAVVRDESVGSMPDRYPVYTEKELEQLASVSDSTLRLVHEAKKMAGAVLESVDTKYG